MCGRYSLTSPVEAVRKVFGFAARPNLAPRANIAPSQEVAAVRLGPGESGDVGQEHGGRCFVWLRWGLIPAWAKDPAIGNRMINARAETLAEKPAFRSAFRKRRCLILADGFYEWKSESGRKQPYRITLTGGGPFALAGLWERWTDPQGAGTIESCTIITTEANARLREIHHRMPGSRRGSTARPTTIRRSSSRSTRRPKRVGSRVFYKCVSYDLLYRSKIVNLATTRGPGKPHSWGLRSQI
jgi:putative SOS response-associated peptidase YedK